MSKNFKTVKPCPTDLTWEEQNPSSYLLNVEVLTKLQQAIKKAKKGGSGLSKSREQQERHTFEKNK